MYAFFTRPALLCIKIEKENEKLAKKSIKESIHMDCMQKHINSQIFHAYMPNTSFHSNEKERQKRCETHTNMES